MTLSNIIWWWGSLEKMPALALYQALALRSQVFVVEQDCVYLDADGLDTEAMHLNGSVEGQVVATLRVFGPGAVKPDAMSIGRVVVAPQMRGVSLGRELMKEGISRATGFFGDHSIHVSAQAQLEKFYGSLGFSVCGQGYDEDGIPHLPMLRPPNRE